MTSAPISTREVDLGPGAEHRPALEVLAVRLAVQRVEVVPVEGDVDADLLGRDDRAPQLGPLRVLRLQLDADPDLAVVLVLAHAVTF